MTNNNATDIMTAASRSMDIAVRYGVNETSPLWTSEVTHETITDEVQLNDPRLERIARLRLFAEAGYPFYDISYCYGVLKDGTHVRVHLDEHRISRRNAKGDLIAMAKRAKVFAKGLGLLDRNNWSILG
jgi:hypothetical protein